MEEQKVKREYIEFEADTSINEQSDASEFDEDEDTSSNIGDEADEHDEENDESDNISDEDECSLFNGDGFDYMAEVGKLLETHSEVKTDNAIALNRHLQEMLEKLRSKILTMLEKCREKYMKNQEELINPSCSQITHYLKSVGNCGRPFFKDANNKPCPSNGDYKYRSEIERELFPIDLELFPHFVWTTTDKVGILQGIKEQIIEYLERKQTYGSSSSVTKKSKIEKNIKLHTLKLTKLLEKVDSDFTIDWNQISHYNLNSRHTANSCFAIWNVYLKPEINRDEWTEEENIKLNELAKKYKFQDWISIAAEMDRRSDYQCFVQYQTVVSLKMREDKGERWSKEEDELLLSLVEKHRMGNVIRWNPICSQLPNRTKKQCFARYKYSINPSILRAPFTAEEDCIILAAVEEYGENFNCFPKALFPNRTVVQIRNHYYNSLKCRENIRFWTPEDDKTLLELVKKYGSKDWRKISDEIKTHTRTSCRTRYTTISKFLKDNPNASVEHIPRKNRRPNTHVTKSNWVEAISELKNQSPRIKDKSKELYRFRLRNNELKWYNFLKFSYDYKFGQGYNQVPASMASIEFMSSALDVQLKSPFELHDRYATSTVRVTLKKLMRLRSEGDKSLQIQLPPINYRLPPNYSSLLAFRGLCIQTAGIKDEEKQPSPIIQKYLDNMHCASQKLRKRLHCLLYTTTLLSRLDPNETVEKSNFNLVFDTNTQFGQIANKHLAEIKVQRTKEIAENILVTMKKADEKRNCDETLIQLEKSKRVAQAKINFAAIRKRKAELCESFVGPPTVIQKQEVD